MSKPPQIKVEFGEADDNSKRKEAVFGALLKNYLMTKGYFVATPEPDLGDDLWIAKSHGHVLRAQLKSLHTSTAESYCTRICDVTRFQTQARGFHFGLIPSRFFKDKYESNWKDKKSGRGGGHMWVYDGQAFGQFRYKLDGIDVTRYFGQIEIGWKEAFSRVAQVPPLAHPAV